jgi:arginine N-succinyltransferase
MVIRPVAADDLDALVELANHTGHGLTTLPRDREILRRRIDRSRRSFDGIGDAPGGEQYLFVLEDLPSRQAAGTCGIIAKVGGYEPFYAYRIDKSVHESEFLGVRKEVPTLHLVAEHNGPSEVCSLFLSPRFRASGAGRLLSISRFLFMAEHPGAFDKMVIAEMRGVVDSDGRSPFWDAIGKHFFDIDFPKADYLSMVNKRFIAELMPKHPIYIPLLPEAAQQVIAQVHPETRPAVRLLESEGFAFNGMVDIFEAGPIVVCPLEKVRTARLSRRSQVAEVVDSPAAGADSVVAAVKPGQYRATRAHVEMISDTNARIAKETALALGLETGDFIRHSPFK